MMHTVGQIVKQRRERLGLTLAQLADAVGATKGYLSMIENERVANPPSSALLGELEQALGISDGELTRTADWQNTPTPVRQKLEQAVDTAQQGKDLAHWLKQATGQRGDGARSLDELYSSGQLGRRINKFLKVADAPEGDSGTGELDSKVGVRYRVPVINQVSAGYPKDFTDLDYPRQVSDDYVAAPDVTDPDAFAARVVGDSMSPDYREGDIIVFSPETEVTDGCDCFVRLEPDHETTFKRVFFEEGDRLRIQPLNPQYPPRVVERENVAGLYRAVCRISSLS
jgi:phage repressor protein C with HTH and peptisase S24 domain/DNA-binding XRE family transcriptional regulator